MKIDAGWVKTLVIFDLKRRFIFRALKEQQRHSSRSSSNKNRGQHNTISRGTPPRHESLREKLQKPLNICFIRAVILYLFVVLSQEVGARQGDLDPLLEPRTLNFSHIQVANLELGSEFVPKTDIMGTLKRETKSAFLGLFGSQILLLSLSFYFLLPFFAAIRHSIQA